MNVAVEGQDADGLVLAVSGEVNSLSAKEFQRLMEEARNAPLGIRPYGP